MLFKDISYLELLQPFCSVKNYNLGNFGSLLEGIMRNNLWNYFESWSVVYEMSFKRFLIWGSGFPPVQWSGTVNAILKEGIMGTFSEVI